MSKEKKINIPAFSELPEEIIFDILSRLPVDTLLKCRRVSKPWRKIITNPRFTKHHLERSKQTSNNFVIISDASFKFSYLDVETLVLTTLILDHHMFAHHKHEFLVVGSCNGIICLREFRTYVSLWNPLLREYFMLPLDPIDPKIQDEKKHVVLGFGYSPVTDRYEVVKLIHFFSERKKKFYLSKIKVFTIGTNWTSWKSVHAWKSIKIEPSYLFRNPNTAMVHLHGILHWLNTDHERTNDDVTQIVCYDVGIEKIHILPCPEGSFGQDELNLGVVQQCLCFSRRRQFECLDIWLMKNSSWTQLFSLNLPNTLQLRGFEDNHGEAFEPVEFQRNGELLLKFGKKEAVLYNPSMGTFKCLSVEGIDDWTTTFTHEEGLTSLAQLTGKVCEEERHKRGWLILCFMGLVTCGLVFFLSQTRWSNY